MEEKTYKTMKMSGALNIVAGVFSIVAGLTGILLIISGGKLLARKSEVLF